MDENLREAVLLRTTENIQSFPYKQHYNNEGKRWKAYFETLKQDREFRKKFIKTCMLCWSFVNYGITIGQFGPSLLDLQEITQSKLSQISGAITAAGIGYMTGAILTGIIDNRIQIDFLCFLSCFGSSIFTAIIPWCSIFEIMILLNLLRGSMGGVLDTAGNTMLIELWGKKSSSYMQALHFSWAFGSIISPLFTAPFLSKLTSVFILNSTTSSDILNITCHRESEEFTSNESDCKWNNTVEISLNTSRLNEISKTEFKLYIPYSIAAFLFMTASFCFLASYILSFCSDNPKSGKKENRIRINKTKNSIKTSSSRESVLQKFAILNLSLLIMTYVSVEGIFGALLVAFSVTKLGWTKVKGSFLTSVFSGSLCVGRFLSVGVIRFLGSSKLILVYSTILCMTMAGFLISSVFTFEVGLWLATAVAGLSGSAIFPGILTWTEEFVPMTRRVTSSIMVGSSIGWMTIPYVVGILMDTVSPMFFCYFALGVCVVVIALYITASLLYRQLKKYATSPINASYIV